MLLPAVGYSTLSLLLSSLVFHLKWVKRILCGRGQSHSLATPRMRTPPNVWVGINKSFDIKIEKPLSHFTRYNALNHILNHQQYKNNHQEYRSCDGHVTILTHQWYQFIAAILRTRNAMCFSSFDLPFKVSRQWKLSLIHI